MATAADVEQTGLSTGAEPFIGGVVCPVGEQGLGGDVSIQRDSLHHAGTLVNELHGSGKNKNMRNGFQKKERVKELKIKSD